MASRSIDIVINAKDKTPGAFASITKGLRSFVGSVFSFNGLLTSALAGLGASLTLKSFIDAAEESAAASAKLNSVLQSTGGVVGFTSAQLQTMAADLQRVTKFSDDTIVNGEAVLATFTNIRGDVFKDALGSALDLSTVLGQDLQSSVLQIGKALNDPIKGMTALTRAGVSFTSAQKEQIRTLQSSGNLLGAQKIILGELAREFGGAATAAGKTFGGQIIILKNAFSDLQESIGFGIGDALLATFPNLSASMGDFTETIFRWAESAVTAFTKVQQLWGLMLLRIDAAVLGFHVFADTFTWLMGIVENLLGWLGDNWQKVLTDMVAFQKIVMLNMATNILTFAASLPDLIAGKVSFADLWTPLTTGFKATMSELPAIAKLEGSALTQQMAKDLAQRSEALSDKNTDALAQERIARMRAFRDDRAGKNIKPGAPTPGPFSALGTAFGIGGVGGLLGQLASGVKLPDVQAAAGKAGGLLSGAFGPNSTLGQLFGFGTGGTPGKGPIEQRSSGLASLEESRFLTGVGAASRERNPNAKVEKKLDDSNKTQNKTLEAVKDLARAFREGGAGQFVGFSGN